MFIEKTVKPYTVAHISLGLVLILLLAITDLLTTSPSWSAPLTQNTPTAIPTPTVPVMPAVSARCERCIAWPNSDMRMDAAQGYNADIDPVKFEGLRDIPLVLAFGVADNGVILRDDKGVTKQLHYKWESTSCAGSHNAYLTGTQANFITNYNPTFFASPVIDSATQFERFVPFFQKQNPNTLLGTYYSAVTCIDGATSPYAESFYPSSVADCHRFAQFTPASMHTRLWPSQSCQMIPVRWYVDVGDIEVRARFQNDFIQSVKAIKPRPAFVFLDNVSYLEPAADSQPGLVDCRERAQASNSACRYSHIAFAKEFGEDIYFDDFIEQYRGLITRLEVEGVRTILNVGTVAALLDKHKDPKYVEKFEETVDKNGIYFEHAFDINLRTNFTATLHEVELHQRLLQQGKLVVVAPSEIGDKNASSWMATMAMLIREPKQSLFVARDAYSSTLDWISWPMLYGSPVATATLQPVSTGNRSIVGDNWFMQRQFQKDGITREITAVHFGINLQNAKTFSMTLLAPDLSKEPYELLYRKPQLGTWDQATGVYTATHRSDLNGSVEADYFILGAQCDSARKFCRKLIAVSVGVFK